MKKKSEELIIENQPNPKLPTIVFGDGPGSTDSMEVDIGGRVNLRIKKDRIEAAGNINVKAIISMFVLELLSKYLPKINRMKLGSFYNEKRDDLRH